MLSFEGVVHGLPGVYFVAKYYENDESNETSVKDGSLEMRSIKWLSRSGSTSVYLKC